MNIHENRLEATVEPISMDTELLLWLATIELHLETVLTK